jgi:hypothetical protein
MHWSASFEMRSATTVDGVPDGPHHGAFTVEPNQLDEPLIAAPGARSIFWLWVLRNGCDGPKS